MNSDSLALTGTLLEDVVPSPSWPRALYPQQYAAPSEVAAQVWDSPASSRVALARPSTVTGIVWMVLAPLPSCPCMLLPQHFTFPPTVSAQVWALPALIACTPL